MGITDYGQAIFGDACYVGVESIDVEREMVKGADLCPIDTTYSGLVDIEMPVNGKVIEVNQNLDSVSEILSRDPENEGWICKVKVESFEEINNLMTKEEYSKFIERDARRRDMERPISN